MFSVDEAVGKQALSFTTDGNPNGYHLMEENLAVLFLKKYMYIYLWLQKFYIGEFTLKVHLNMKILCIYMHKVIHFNIICNCKISETTQISKHERLVE